jgi:hypothetical protein
LFSVVRPSNSNVELGLEPCVSVFPVSTFSNGATVAGAFIVGGDVIPSDTTEVLVSLTMRITSFKYLEDSA